MKGFLGGQLEHLPCMKGEREEKGEVNGSKKNFLSRIYIHGRFICNWDYQFIIISFSYFSYCLFSLDLSLTVVATYRLKRWPRYLVH